MKRKLHAGKRLSGGFGLPVLTEDEMEEIHLATMEVLEKTGVFVEDEQALEVFASGGAHVDKHKKMVTLPSYVVEDAIRSAPSKFIACGRVPKDDVVLESNRTSFANFGEGIMILDPYSKEHRETVKQDLANVAKIIDYLDCIDVYERAMLSHDVPQLVSPLHNAEASLSNTTKHHFLGPASGYNGERIVEMLEAIVGGREQLRKRPLLTFVTCPISPLKLVRDCCEVTMVAARSGIAVNIISVALAGATAPVTPAGTLVTHNAEVLASITLNQLTQKGAPVIYGCSTTGMDLRLGTASVGTPEMAMINAAVARLAQFYSLPSFVAGG